jgi:hypothetical protein
MKNLILFILIFITLSTTAQSKNLPDSAQTEVSNYYGFGIGISNPCVNTHYEHFLLKSFSVRIDLNLGIRRAYYSFNNDLGFWSLMPSANYYFIKTGNTRFYVGGSYSFGNTFDEKLFDPDLVYRTAGFHLGARRTIKNLYDVKAEIGSGVSNLRLGINFPIKT